MKLVSAVTAAVGLLCLCVSAQANVFNLGSGLTNLEMVRVGDAGNSGDYRYGSAAMGSGAASYGSVAYEYQIGKYEVTTAQYCDFLNAKARTDSYGLYNTAMANIPDSKGCNIQRSGLSGSYSYRVGSGSSQDLTLWGNRPVNYISYWDACRFANWLNNGQGGSSTETGAYTLVGYNGDLGGTIQRNAGANWYLPSEDEWYKASYYRGSGTNSGYWDYATQNLIWPANAGCDGYVDPGNHANYYTSAYTIGGPYWRTNAGEFENSASAYGTFDQNGNVEEWTEVIPYQDDINAYREVRGGGFGSNISGITASSRYYWNATHENFSNGFRVASAVPEPSSLIPLAGGLLALVGMRRRRA